eukprot:scaffold56135_cov28-Tisochrysis_lutea.AAC.5
MAAWSSTWECAPPDARVKVAGHGGARRALRATQSVTQASGMASSRTLRLEGMKYWVTLGSRRGRPAPYTGPWRSADSGGGWHKRAGATRLRAPHRRERRLLVACAPAHGGRPELEAPCAVAALSALVVHPNTIAGHPKRVQGGQILPIGAHDLLGACGVQVDGDSRAMTQP